MPVNLWPVAYQKLREAGQLKGLTRADGWPKGLTPRQLAVLQWPGNPSGASAWLPEIGAALANKSLPSFSQQIETPRFPPTPTARAWSITLETLQVIAAPDFAAWLRSQGIEPSPNIQAWADARAPAITVPAPVAADEINFDMLATRQQLIDAFGKFTGMDATWFKNLNTSPRLRDARKSIGQGGRHIAEPLFCPFEVMKWLADPKRKKGRKLGDEKAWQLLKAHFPKAYALNSIGDPNAD